MLTITKLADGRAIFCKTVADHQFAFGPIMESVDEAQKFRRWLHDRDLDAEIDLTERGFSYRLTLYREERQSEQAARLSAAVVAAMVREGLVGA